MMKLFTALLVVSLACSCSPSRSGGTSGESSAATPDLTKLTNGMAFAEFQAMLGTTGRIQPQPSPVEAHFIFDLDQKFVVAAVRTHPKPEVVTKFWVREDDLSVEQRRDQRDKNISRAVVRPRLSRTNGVPNQ